MPKARAARMKIVIAFDSFKGSLTAESACREAALALVEQRPEAVPVEKPMADGGEGTAAALLAARGGEWIQAPATGPLPSMTVDAGYAWLAADETAVVEMASASGLTLLRRDQLNPLATTTLGTGELVRAALERNPRRLLLAVGGSATVDGGIGAAHALGWRFLDERGDELPPIGASLARIHTIRPPDRRPPAGLITVLSDVTNPLCGPRGAAPVFGPQKGASPEQVALLDHGLERLAACIHAQLGRDLRAMPGGGAAGGLAAGAVAFMNATIQPGIETIMNAAGLADALDGADWVVTGEGSFDEQSLHGKVVSGVARIAQARGVRVAVLAGRIALDPARFPSAGIAYADAITPPGLSMDDAIRQAPHLLHQAVVRFVEECV